MQTSLLMRVGLRTLGPERPLRLSALLVLAYAVAYLLQSWPQARRFWTHSWMDDGDGLVMVWNLWLARLQPLDIAHTDLLFHPHGVSLLAHTYVPLAGWLGAVLPLPLFPTLNLLLLGSFGLAGCFAFWLAWRSSHSLAGSLFAGYAYAFTGFHWAHATGHLNLASTQILPLFALVWLRYEERPDRGRAALTAAVLLATALTDYYFAVFCAMLAALFVLGRRMPWSDLGRVLALVLPTTGAFTLWVLVRFARDPVLGAHDPAAYSLDPVSLFVPGAHWRFSELTRVVWERVAGNPNETGVHLGLALWIAILWKARCRRWWAVLVSFLVLALGEHLTLLGHATPIPLPYRLLEIFVPPLEHGGVPSRMVIMVALAASVLGAMAVARLGRRTTIALSLLLVVELLPGPRPITRPAVPGWVEVLADQEHGGALLDVRSDPKRAMYYQTLHGHPISGGALARLPASAVAWNQRLYEMHESARPDLIASVGYRYVLIDGYRIGGAELLWSEGERRLYRLGS